MRYLDHNATAPPRPEVLAAVAQAQREYWANPSSPHAAGRAAAMALDRARAQVAALVGRDPREVIFTSGATEANALALAGLRRPNRPSVLVSAVEHPSALAWGTHFIPVNSEGVIDLEALERLAAGLRGELAVISVMAANNETGALQPVAEAAAIARSLGIPFHCDAAQLPGRLPVRVDADLLTLSAHKMGGPRGVGALVTALEPAPLLRGGPQERGRRAGTSDVPGIVGMGVAASLAGTLDPGPRDALQAACVRLGGRVLSANAPRLPNTLSVLFPHPGDLLVMALDLAGIAASTGSACSSGASEPSHVLAAMGILGVPVRFSLGEDSDMDPTIQVLERVLAQMEGSCGW